MSCRTRQPVLAAMTMVLLSGQAAAEPESAASADTITERVPLFTVIPHYPKLARRDRIEGAVKVCFDITRDGRTRRIAVRESTHRVFEKPAIRAIRVSTYEPLPKDAVMSGIKSCRTFRFTLEPKVLETSD